MEATAVVENPCRFITLPYCTRNHSSPSLLCKFATSKTDALLLFLSILLTVFTDAEIEEHGITHKQSDGDDAGYRHALG